MFENTNCRDGIGILFCFTCILSLFSYVLSEFWQFYLYTIDDKFLKPLPPDNYEEVLEFAFCQRNFFGVRVFVLN